MHGQPLFNGSTRISRVALISATCLLPWFLGSTAVAADQSVTNTADSGAGSLRQAVADVGAGEDVSFQPAVAGGTITLSSNLDVSRSMNFNNDSGGAVTVNTGSYSMNVADASTISLNSGLTFHTTREPAIRGAGSLGIAGLHGDVTAETTGLIFAYGIITTNGLSITDGLSGTVSANAPSDMSFTITSNSGDISIAGGLSGDVSATGWMAYGMSATSGGINGGDPDTPLLITGNVSTNGSLNSTAIRGAQVNLKLEETGTLSAISASP